MQTFLTLLIVLVIIGSGFLAKHAYANNTTDDFIEHAGFIAIVDAIFIAILWNIWQ